MLLVVQKRPFRPHDLTAKNVFIKRSAVNNMFSGVFKRAFRTVDVKTESQAIILMKSGGKGVVIVTKMMERGRL